MRTTLAVAILIAIGGPTLAQQDCSKVEQQQHMNACASDNARAADRRLNSLYNDLQKLVGEGARTKLRDAQRAWIAYRDKSCDLEGYGVEGGSLRPYVLAICHQQITEERITRLKYYLTCEDGDATCVRGFR